MIDTYYMIEGFLLLAIIVLSWIDIRKREFPAPLTSGVLLVVALVMYQNISFGILGFIVAWFLMEMEFFSGTADLKLFTAVSLVMPNYYFFMLFVILMLVFGTVYKGLMVKVMKKRQEEEIAFIPVFLFVFITLLIIIYVI